MAFCVINHFTLRNLRNIIGSMSSTEIKALIKKWAKRDGEHTVKAALIGQRLSTSLVDQVLSDRYPGEIRGANLTVIENELKRAGFIKDEAS